MASSSLGLNILQAYESDSEPDSSCNSSNNNDGDGDCKSREKPLSSRSSPGKEHNKCYFTFLNDGDGVTGGPSAKRSRIDVYQKQEQCAHVILPHDANISKSGVNENNEPKPSLPSVPLNILQMFHDTHGTSKTKDDPSLHMGRQRSFPHVRGNWASYIYIHCQENLPVINELNNMICDIGKSMEELIHSLPDKHLTLSRTLSLRHHWIEPLTDNLKRTISTAKSFDLCLDQFDAYANEEKSRTFISMKVFGTKQLFDIVGKCDECLGDFQLEPYYKHPSFHVSCAWMLGDKTDWAKQKLIPDLNNKWSASLRNDPDMQMIPVSTVEFKTGNQLYRFYLQK